MPYRTNAPVPHRYDPPADARAFTFWEVVGVLAAILAAVWSVLFIAGIILLLLTTYTPSKTR